MDRNKILRVVLAGRTSQRFGQDKSQVTLNDKMLINYVLCKIKDEFKEILVVANEKINFIESDKISLLKDDRKVELWANKIGVKKIEIDFSNNDPFLNINTQEDIEKVKRIIKND